MQGEALKKEFSAVVREFCRLRTFGFANDDVLKVVFLSSAKNADSEHATTSIDAAEARLRKGPLPTQKVYPARPDPSLRKETRKKKRE